MLTRVTFNFFKPLRPLTGIPIEKHDLLYLYVFVIVTDFWVTGIESRLTQPPRRAFQAMIKSTGSTTASETQIQESQGTRARRLGKLPGLEFCLRGGCANSGLGHGLDHHQGRLRLGPT